MLFFALCGCRLGYNPSTALVPIPSVLCVCALPWALPGYAPASAEDCFRLLFSDESTFVYRYRGVRKDTELEVSACELDLNFL